MRVYEYLADQKEEMPQWLREYEPGQRVDFTKVLSSRVVYYPGSGDDGQGIRTFNEAEYAHVFFHADYGITKADAREMLSRENALRGYRLLDLQEIKESALTPRGWRPHVRPRRASFHDDMPALIDEKPYCLFAVYEKKEEADVRGAQRFAVIQLFGDGIASYDALFANRNARIDVLILQDHGFGGNYDRFGRGGLMDEVARKSGVYPKYICCEHEQNVWDGYALVEGVEPEVGGVHGNERKLFVRR